MLQNLFPSLLFLLFILFDVNLFFFDSVGVNFASQCVPFSNSPSVKLSCPVGVPFSEGVAFPIEASNRNFKDYPFLRESLSSPEELCVLGNDSSPKPEPPTLLLKAFQIEGLMPRKMVKV